MYRVGARVGIPLILLSALSWSIVFLSKDANEYLSAQTSGEVVQGGGQKSVLPPCSFSQVGLGTYGKTVSASTVSFDGSGVRKE